jgi:hypothetical protein
MLKTSSPCNISKYYSEFRIDEKEFMLLNLEVPLTFKQPVPDESIGAYATFNIGFKQYMQCNFTHI